jgi:hypothetical protein
VAVGRVQVIGSGPAAQELAHRVRVALAAIHSGALVEIRSDLADVCDHELDELPALIVDGRLVLAGWVPSRAELHDLLALTAV